MIYNYLKSFDFSLMSFWSCSTNTLCLLWIPHSVRPLCIHYHKKESALAIAFLLQFDPIVFVLFFHACSSHCIGDFVLLHFQILITFSLFICYTYPTFEFDDMATANAVKRNDPISLSFYFFSVSLYLSSIVIIWDCLIEAKLA